jgi:RNA polymerase sigma-70 factor (ECF subfamily)
LQVRTVHTGERREDPSDEELLRGFLAGDAGAFEAIVQRFATELFTFVVRFVGSAASAEDVVQETFLQVHQSAGGFDSDRRFKPWLFTIAANKARDHLRSRARKRERSVETGRGGEDENPSLLEILSDPSGGPEEALETNEQRELVRQVIDEMPEHLREVLLLGYYQRFAYKDIAEVLGIPLGTVKSRLHAAVANFAAAYRRRAERKASR